MELDRARIYAFFGLPLLFSAAIVWEFGKEGVIFLAGGVVGIVVGAFVAVAVVVFKR